MTAATAKNDCVVHQDTVIQEKVKEEERLSLYQREIQDAIQQVKQRDDLRLGTVALGCCGGEMGVAQRIDGLEKAILACESQLLTDVGGCCHCNKHKLEDARQVIMQMQLSHLKYDAMFQCHSLQWLVQRLPLQNCNKDDDNHNMESWIKAGLFHVLSLNLREHGRHPVIAKSCMMLCLAFAFGATNAQELDMVRMHLLTEAGVWEALVQCMRLLTPRPRRILQQQQGSHPLGQSQRLPSCSPVALLPGMSPQEEMQQQAVWLAQQQIPAVALRIQKFLTGAEPLLDPALLVKKVHFLRSCMASLWNDSSMAPTNLLAFFNM